jgi:hypothetical protein
LHRERVMDWGKRIAAIVLAGGSVAGCAGADEPGDGGTFAPPLASSEGRPALFVGPAPTIQVDRVPVNRLSQPGPRYRIPLCNANPDPCCRSPDSQGCEDAGPRVTVKWQGDPQ